jgi:RNA polymerase II subunit A C-terminal domain phosphatase SSU72
MDATAQLRIGCVCASNMNRSMEAHGALALRGYSVRSYGTGSHVRLPGLAADRPAVFDFGTPYEAMKGELRRVSPDVYAANGVLAMLDRNAKIKRAPEQWASSAKERFDVVLCFEARVFEAVVEDFVCSRSPTVFQPAFVVNLEVLDTHAAAAEGAKVAVSLVEQLDACADVQTEINRIIEDVEQMSDSHIFCVPVFF